MVVSTVSSNNVLLLLTKISQLVTSLKFVINKCDNYLLTLDCTEAHVTCDE